MKFPSDGDRRIVCDVCGVETRVKHTVQISDRYNTLYKMIVCKRHADKTNGGNYPQRRVVERGLSNPLYVRTQGSDNFVENENEDRLPSAPRNARATLDPLSDAIQLTWDGPEQLGNGRILGYQITQREPQTGGDFIIEPNTLSQAGYYLDIISDTDGSYGYFVAAVSTVGVGPNSEIAYFPRNDPDDDVYNYLGLSQNSNVMTTGSGVYIIL